MSLIRNRFFSLFCFIVSFSILTIMGACSSDDNNPNPVNTGGSAGKAGNDSGVGGIAGKGGSGGQTGGQAGQAGTGGQGNPWKKGVPGKASGAKVIAEHSGLTQGPTATTSYKPMGVGGTSGDGGSAGEAGSAGDAGSAGASGEAGSAGSGPDTAPKVDFSNINPKFSQLWVAIPPYTDLMNVVIAPPRVGIITPDAKVTVIEPFVDWQTYLMPFGWAGTIPLDVNGVQMRGLKGLNLNMAYCAGRHFWISNVGNKIYEIFENQPMTVLVDNLSPMGGVICHPDGYLVAGTLPQFTVSPLTATKGIELIKITLDSPPVVSTIASLPMTVDDDAGNPILIQLTGSLPFMANDERVPLGLRVPVAYTSNGKYLVGDIAAQTVYSLNADGTDLQPHPDMPINMVAMISPPNGLIYMLESPILGSFPDSAVVNVTLQGAKIETIDPTDWTRHEILTLPAPDYDSIDVEFYLRVPCSLVDPNQYDGGQPDHCTIPWGELLGLDYDDEPALFVFNPDMGTIYGITLDMGDADAGIGGAGGEAGSAGSAGEAGSAGSAGEAGAAGSAGEAGAAGAGGT